ncbi:MAG: hypothetical protein D6713_03940 [Deltaproteobacteria bacterium]|nr:MAG: hypothetical protein D6713_03940 [Deltaproteobacteria bacterium]
MAASVKVVPYYKMETPNKAGEAAKVLSQLKDAGVNLLAYTAFPRKRKAQMDFVPEDNAKFRRAAKKLGLPVSERKNCFLIQGDDRVGALQEVVQKLADAGINITAVDAVTAGKGRFGAILWVKEEDFRKAKKALGAK